MARVFVTRALPGLALNRLEAAHDTAVWADRSPPSYEQIRTEAATADGLLTMLTDRIDAELIAAAPRLKVVSNYAVGYDNIDTAAAREREIAVGHTPDVLTDATADLTWALMLALARGIPNAASAGARGDWGTWAPRDFLGADVYGATLGIIGAGRIGRAVAERAAGFKMNVLTAARGDRSALEYLIANADYISLHCPLTDDTRHLINAETIAAMKPNAFLVNTARGGIVDHEALRLALWEGRIAGAALDVTDPEPLPPEHPLHKAPNLIITPHIGSATHTARAKMAEIAVDNLLAGLAGEPLAHAVPPPPT
jgi:glyoxylate reductase